MVWEIYSPRYGQGYKSTDIWFDSGSDPVQELGKDAAEKLVTKVMPRSKEKDEDWVHTEYDYINIPKITAVIPATRKKAAGTKIMVTTWISRLRSATWSSKLCVHGVTVEFRIFIDKMFSFMHGKNLNDTDMKAR